MYIVFDFDGTLVDSMPRLQQQAVLLFQFLYNVDPDDAIRMYQSTAGLSFPEQLQSLFPQYSNRDLNEYAAKKFRRNQLNVYKTVQLFPEVSSALELLEQDYIPWAVCSSSPVDFVQKTLDRLLPDLNPPAVGIELGTKREQLKGFRFRKPTFIGDVPRDGFIAVNEGIDFIGVARTRESVETFAKAGLRRSKDLYTAVERVLRGPGTVAEIKAVNPTHHEQLSLLDSSHELPGRL